MLCFLFAKKYGDNNIIRQNEMKQNKLCFLLFQKKTLINHNVIYIEMIYQLCS